MREFDKSKLVENKGTEEVLTISLEDKDSFMNGCSVEKDVVVDVFNHSRDYIKDATQFAADIATERFKKDSKLQKVFIDIPYGPNGAGSVSVAAEREKTFRVPGTDKTITRPNVTTKVVDKSIKVTKKHIENLQDAMLEALKK